MKMYQLEQATAVLQKLYTIENKSILKARRAMKKITGELELFQKAKDEYIQKHGKDGTIEQGTPEFEKAMEYLGGLMNEEVEVTWEPVWTEDEVLELDVDLSMKDLDLMESIGLIK